MIELIRKQTNDVDSELIPVNGYLSNFFFPSHSKFYGT